MGLVHIYCGDGKGKTSAAAGLAVRAAGRGIPVIIARFLKTDDSGEVPVLEKIPGITVIPCEEKFGFVNAMDEDTKERATRYNRQLFERASEAAYDMSASGGDPDQDSDVNCVLILDEIITAINFGMIPEEDVTDFLEKRPAGLETVLTGRDPSKRLLQEADYISRIDKVRHPYDRGITARKGIEY